MRVPLDWCAVIAAAAAILGMAPAAVGVIGECGIAAVTLLMVLGVSRAFSL